MKQNQIYHGKIDADTVARLRDEEIAERLEDFRDMQQLYNAAIREIRTKLEILDEEFSVHHAYNPIHNIESRLKSPSSIAGKLTKLGKEVSVESIRENLFDVAGVRVICSYIEDIYRVADILVGQDDVTLVRTRDYIAHPKENGYRSLHLIVKIPVFLSSGVYTVPAEIQLRTIAMDFWASLEHRLHYKTDADVPESLRRELVECAETAAALDLHMQDIYRQIRDGEEKPQS